MKVSWVRNFQIWADAGNKRATRDTPQANIYNPVKMELYPLGIKSQKEVLESEFMLVSTAFPMPFCRAQPSCIFLITLKLHFDIIDLLGFLQFHFPQPSPPLLLPSSQQSRDRVSSLLSFLRVRHLQVLTCYKQEPKQWITKWNECRDEIQNNAGTAQSDWLSDIALGQCPGASWHSICWIMGKFRSF